MCDNFTDVVLISSRLLQANNSSRSTISPAVRPTASPEASAEGKAESPSSQQPPSQQNLVASAPTTASPCKSPAPATLAKVCRAFRLRASFFFSFPCPFQPLIALWIVSWVRARSVQNRTWFGVGTRTLSSLEGRREVVDFPHSC